MKRLIQIATMIVIAAIMLISFALYPKFSNLKSEYATAEAIRDIDSYVRENRGQWPSSPEKLESKYPIGGDVMIDYSVTTSQLIANPDKLFNAVRPRSGKFLTYPHFRRQIDELHTTLRETSQR